MKRLVLLTLVILGVSSLAFGQANPGSIGVFIDQAGTDCNIPDAGPPGILPVYMVHVGSNGAQASMWMLDTPPPTLTYVGESSPFSVIIGSTLTGISIAYASCYTSPFLVATVNFFATGATPACAYLSIIPNPSAENGLLEIIDCSLVKHELTAGGQAVINSDGSCDCNVATQETSWGGIKSLYK